jgi:hypothetical protein
MDLFSELDEAERVATEEESDNGTRATVMRNDDPDQKPSQP